MKFRIANQFEDSIYCVVEADDGSTFGQHVIGEEMKSMAGIEGRIKFVLANQAAMAAPPSAEVLELIASKSEVIVAVDTGKAVLP